MKKLFALLILLAAVATLPAATPLASVTRTNSGIFAAGSNVVIVGSGAYTWALPVEEFTTYTAAGDKSIGLGLENWRRMLYRGSNATVLAFGDSTGLYTLQGMRPALFYTLGSNGFGLGSMTPLHLAGAYTNDGASSSTNWPGAHYTLGTNATDGPGEMAATNWSGTFEGGTWSDTFRCYVEKSPSAGTLIWQTKTNGGAWTSRAVINASGTYGVVATQINLSPLGWYRSRLVYSNGGPTRVYGLEQFDASTTGRGVRMHDLTFSGSRIGQLTNIATNILGPSLRLLNPAVVMMEHRDSSNEYVNALPALRSLLTNWIPEADVVIIGVGPMTVGDYDLVGQNSVARDWCRTNGWGYMDMRAQKNFSSYWSVTNFYGAADGSGTHYPDAAQQAQADFSLWRAPWLENGTIHNGYVKNGGTAGRRYFDPLAATNRITSDLGLEGRTTIDDELIVSGAVNMIGAGSGAVWADRSAPTDSARNWTLLNNAYELTFYQNAYVFAMDARFGVYRFSPYSAAAAPGATLGDLTRYWGSLFASNATFLGNQTNLGRIRIGTGGDLAISENGASITGDRGILLFDAGTPTIAVAGRVIFAASGTDAASSDTTIYRSSAGTLGLGTTASTPAGSLIASNHTATGAYILQSATGPVGISNGLSAFWNSNGVATYLRSGPTGYTTNKDTVIAIH